MDSGTIPSLPNECLLRLFWELDIKELNSCARVSRKWRNASLYYLRNMESPYFKEHWNTSSYFSSTSDKPEIPRLTHLCGTSKDLLLFDHKKRLVTINMAKNSYSVFIPLVQETLLDAAGAHHYYRSEEYSSTISPQEEKLSQEELRAEGLNKALSQIPALFRKALAIIPSRIGGDELKAINLEVERLEAEAKKKENENFTPTLVGSSEPAFDNVYVALLSQEGYQRSATVYLCNPYPDETKGLFYETTDYTPQTVATPFEFDAEGVNRVVLFTSRCPGLSDSRLPDLCLGLIRRLSVEFRILYSGIQASTQVVENSDMYTLFREPYCCQTLDQPIIVAPISKGSLGFGFGALIATHNQIFFQNLSQHKTETDFRADPLKIISEKTNSPLVFQGPIKHIQQLPFENEAFAVQDGSHTIFIIKGDNNLSSEGSSRFWKLKQAISFLEGDQIVKFVPSTLHEPLPGTPLRLFAATREAIMVYQKPLLQDYEYVTRHYFASSDMQIYDLKVLDPYQKNDNFSEKQLDLFHFTLAVYQSHIDTNVTKQTVHFLEYYPYNNRNPFVVRTHLQID